MNALIVHANAGTGISVPLRLRFPELLVCPRQKDHPEIPENAMLPFCQGFGFGSKQSGDSDRDLDFPFTHQDLSLR